MKSKMEKTADPQTGSRQPAQPPIKAPVEPRSESISRLNRDSEIDFYKGLVKLGKKEQITQEDRKEGELAQACLEDWKTVRIEMSKELADMRVDDRLQSIPLSEVDKRKYAERMARLALCTFIHESMEHDLGYARSTDDRALYLQVADTIINSESLFVHAHGESAKSFIKAYNDKLDTRLSAYNVLCRLDPIDAQQAIVENIGKAEHWAEFEMIEKVFSGDLYGPAQALEIIEKNIAPLDEETKEILAVPGPLYLNKTKNGVISLSPKVEPDVESIAYTLTMNMTPKQETDYGICILWRGSNLFATLIDRKRKIMVCAPIQNLYRGGKPEWGPFRERIKEALRGASNMKNKKWFILSDIHIETHSKLYWKPNRPEQTPASFGEPLSENTPADFLASLRTLKLNYDMRKTSAADTYKKLMDLSDRFGEYITIFEEIIRKIESRLNTPTSSQSNISTPLDKHNSSDLSLDNLTERAKVLLDDCESKRLPTQTILERLDRLKMDMNRISDEFFLVAPDLDGIVSEKLESESRERSESL